MVFWELSRHTVRFKDFSWPPSLLEGHRASVRSWSVTTPHSRAWIGGGLSSPGPELGLRLQSIMSRCDFHSPPLSPLLAHSVPSLKYLEMYYQKVPSRPHDAFCLIDLRPVIHPSPALALFIYLFFFPFRKKKRWRKCSWNSFLAECYELCFKLLVKCLTFFLRFINIMCKSFRILMESNFPLMRAIKCRFLLKQCLRNKQSRTPLHSQIPPTHQGSPRPER